MSKLKNSVYYVLLYLIPKNWVSCAMGKLVSLRPPRSIAIAINRIFARAFSVDISEAEHPLEHYANLQEFFVRRLKPGLRPHAKNSDVLVSPCDGVMSMAAPIVNNQLMQVKGKHYSLIELVKDRNLAEQLSNGHSATLYLSPRDYHRFHAPVSGEIIQTLYVAGALWPVNKFGVHHIDKLFCQNERVITVIREHHTRKILAHVAVGATMVGKIDLAYCKLSDHERNRGEVNPISHDAIKIEQGDELGKFMFGSTIILLMGSGLLARFTKEAPACVKMSETLGNLLLERKNS